MMEEESELHLVEICVVAGIQDEFMPGFVNFGCGSAVVFEDGAEIQEALEILEEENCSHPRQIQLSLQSLH